MSNYNMDALQKLFADPPAPQEAPSEPVGDGEQIVWIPIDDLIDFPPELHKFPLLPDDKLAELQESIRINGILNPAHIRILADGTRQILSGRNRRRAARNLGYKKMPCIIKDLPDDDDAVLAIIADNRQFRELTPSVLGWSYRKELEIRKRQGQRNDLTSGQNVQKFSRDEISDKASGRKVSRYIRLTYLIDPLQELVDRKKIGLTVGEQLSYLSKESQQIVYGFCYAGEPEHPLKEAQVKKLREVEADPDQIIDEELLEELTAKKKKIRFRTLKLEMNNLREFFPAGTPEEVVVTTIHSALTVYFEKSEDSHQKPPL